MGYERYPRNTNPQGDYYGRQDPQDHGRDHGPGRDYPNARDHGSAGAEDRDERDDARRDYGQRDYGYQRYGQRDQQRTGQQSGQRRYNQDGDYRGGYAPDGRGFDNAGRNRFADDDSRQRGQRTGYGRQPQGYDYEDRGFFERAGDEVRSWFGDDEANRRRDMDARYDGRDDGNRGSSAHDDNYHSWRQTQIAALDRDYAEYRQENRSKFDTEFGSWRTQRQTQRSSLGQVAEHMEVVGSDGGHIGTVDKVRGDRILLTKSDADAGGRHHSIPSRWIDTVADKVTISKTAEDAKAHWRDEERNQAMFGDDDAKRDDPSDDARGKILNRSFSGTY